MASTLRALRPQRNELRRLQNGKPEILTVFETTAQRDDYLASLERFKNELSAQRKTFHEYYDKMLGLTGKDEAAQKTLDDLAESDGAILIEADRLIAQVITSLDQVTRQRNEERAERAADRAAEAMNRTNASVVRSSAVKLPKLE
jgi:hypothetical protein